MPKDEWGVKRVCPHCAVRFYDLQRDPMTCPSCAEEFTLESLTAPKNKSAADRASAAKKATAAEDVVADADVEVVLEDDDDDDDDVVIDAELLDDDDDDDDDVSLDDIADVAKSDDD